MTKTMAPTPHRDYDENARQRLEIAMPRTIRMIIEGQEILSASADTTVLQAARMMKQRKVGAVMVVEDDRLVGIFTERDALFRMVADGRDAANTVLREVMTRSPQTLHPDRSFADALHLMHAGGFRHVPVVEDCRPLGMISARDALGPELEDFFFEMLRQEHVDTVLA
jgi:CBS domain-containing protein